MRRTTPIAMALVQLAPILGITACNPCGDELVADRPAPDGSRVALAFKRDCGATTPVATHMLIRGSSEPKTLEEDKSVFIGEGVINLELVWQSPKELTVRWEARGQGVSVFKADRENQGVTITYQPPAVPLRVQPGT